jgi:hypothetical protein
MAKDMLTEDYYGKRESIGQDWNVKVEVAKLNGGTIPDHPGYPTYPSEKDIITKAQELNGFVSNIETKPTITTKKTTVTQNAA